MTPNSDDAAGAGGCRGTNGLVWSGGRMRGRSLSLAGAPVVDKKIERGAGDGRWAHLRRMHHMIAGLPRGRAASATLDRIETDLRWIARLVVVLVRDEAAVILRAMEERAGCGFLELTPGDASAWFDVAFGGACGAAVRFDPSRGGRLAAPVTIALSHALAGMRAAPAEEGRARAVGAADLVIARVGVVARRGLSRPRGSAAGDRARRRGCCGCLGRAVRDGRDVAADGGGDRAGVRGERGAVPARMERG
ncbi:MAG: hypothetical protein R3B46_07800 [Phycisphaerales bacterium]